MIKELKPVDTNTTWTSSQIRSQFLTFFEQNGHKIMPSSSLIPQNDPTVLLTTAGMQQMIPFFLGQQTPPTNRLTSAQKCFRTTDIDKVGNQRTLTFFEMLGNFSVGDYFKREAIHFAWTLLTEGFHLPAEKLHPTVHPEDDEAPKFWNEAAGFSDDQIVRLEDNWWGPPGASGPCGPDSEIYYDRGPELGCGKPDCKPGCDCERFLEIWNLVFMQFYQDTDGKRTPLAKKNIDTGMGLERLTMVLQGKDSVFETDLFRPIIDKFATLIGTTYGSDPKVDTSLRVIADHGRALVFLAADGVLPSNEGRGYIFRRILRRAVRHGKLLGIDKPFLAEAADTVIEVMSGHYHELKNRRDTIVNILSTEEQKFGQTLSIGLQMLSDTLDTLEKKKVTVIPGDQAFKLYDTHGFPLELTQEVAAERGFSVDLDSFNAAMEKQQEQSKQLDKFTREQDAEALTKLASEIRPTEFTGYTETIRDSRILAILTDGKQEGSISAPQKGSIVLEATPFYAESGGQIGDRGIIKSATGIFQVQDTKRPVPTLIVHYGHVVEGHLEAGKEVSAQVDVERRTDTMKNHSATHLLHLALRELLGDQAHQAGSLVEPERLRFDFNHQRGLTSDEITTIERNVNEWVRADYPVNTDIIGYQEAIKSGAMALFSEKYGDRVRVVSMGTSKELCGGTHVAATGQIGTFVLLQESGVAAGTRRIEALTGRGAEEYLRQKRELLDELAEKLQTNANSVKERLDGVLEELSNLKKVASKYQKDMAQKAVDILIKQAKEVDGIQIIAAQVHVNDDKALREQSDMVRAKLGSSGLIILATTLEDRVSFTVSVTPDLAGKSIHAGKIAEELGRQLGGKGGGRPELAQGGSKDSTKLSAVLKSIPELIANRVH